MDASPQQMDLSAHFPDQAITLQAEHYGQLISALFDNCFVLLIIRHQTDYYLCTDSKHASWVHWAFAEVPFENLHCYTEIDFFWPGYHCSCCAAPLSELHADLYVMLIRHTRIPLSSEQQQAIEVLTEATAQALQLCDLTSLQQTQWLQSQWPFNCETPWRGQLLMQCEGDHFGSTLPLGIFTSHAEAFWQDHVVQNWLQNHRPLLTNGQCHTVRLKQQTNIVELQLWRVAERQCLLSLTDFTTEHEVRLLRQREKLLQGLFDSGIAGMIGLNAKMQLVFANQVARTMLWLPAQSNPHERLSLFHISFYQQTLSDEFVRIEPLAFLENWASGQQAVRCRLEFPGGEHKIVEFRSESRQDIFNPDIVSYCMLIDVTEQYHLQQTLTEMRHHMENLLSFSPVVLYQRGGEANNLIYISPNCEAILGCSHSDLLTDADFFINHVHPDDQPAFNSTNHSTQEFRFWSEQQQQYMWVKDLRQDKGDEHAIYGALTNVSLRKNAEEAQQHLAKELVRQQKLLKQTMDALTDAVITINQQGIILTCNPAVSRLFGYSADELIGGDVTMIMPSKDASQHHRYIDNYRNTGEAKVIGIGRRVMGRHQTGREFPLRLSVAELPSGDHTQRLFVGCLHDLTDVEKQQEQLLQASKLSAIGTLTSGIAHDFNNILGIVRGYAELLANSADSKVGQTALNLIKAADRGSALTKSLLDFSSNRSRETSQFELGQLLKDLAVMLKEACSKNQQIQLVIQQANQPLWINAEKAGLENAILNMVINAVHASPQGGTVQVSLTLVDVEQSAHFVEPISSGRYACLSIADSGSGMSETVLQKIFEPFFTTKGTEGTGLGLAQVFGFIRRSQGGIVVQSELGQGTRFELYLPIVEAPIRQSSAPMPPPIAQKVQATPNINIAQPTILLVDDEAELLEVHAALLDVAGFTVQCCSDPLQALQWIKQHHFSLLISDIVMPQMNGFELCLAAHEVQPELKFQLISGFADESLIINDFCASLYHKRLQKPVRASALISRVQELLVPLSGV